MDRKLKLGAGMLAVGVVVAVAAIGGVSSSTSGKKDEVPKKVFTAKSGQRYVNALKNKPAEGMPDKTRKNCGALPKSYPAQPTTAKFVDHASPEFAPNSAGDLESASELIVIGQVVGVASRLSPDAKPADLKKLPPAARATALQAMREQVATLRVCEVIKGKAGKTIRVSRLGDATVQIESDGPYKPGERYMLYLVKRDAKGKQVTYRPVSLAGRLFLESDGTINNNKDHSPVGAMLDGLPGVNAVNTVVASDVPPPPEPPVPTVTAEDVAKAKEQMKAGKADQVLGDIVEEVGHGS